MAVNLSSLSVYVDENKLDLIRKTVLGPKTIGYLNLQTGVKGKTKINLLETTVTFGDGATCGFADNANTKLSQREIDPASIKINAAFCDKSMQRYFMNHQVTVAAGRSTLPFEEQFVNSLVESTGVELEKAIWNGVQIGSTQYKGFINLIDDGFKSVDVEGTIYEKVRAVYNAIPSASLADTVIFLGIGKYRELAGELTAKNLYHYDPKVDEAFEMILPGTTTKVVGVPGLDVASPGESSYCVALNVKHAFYGTDMEGDEEVFDLWYSKDNQEWRASINFVFGVQVAFPDENVSAKL